MEWGEYARWPIEWGGGEPRTRAIYNGLVRSMGEGRYSTDEDAAVNIEHRAEAWEIEAAEAAMIRASVQAIPSLATDFLPSWEYSLGRAPSPTETEGQRRDVLGVIVSRQDFPDTTTLLTTLQSMGLPVQFIVGGMNNLAFVVPDPTSTTLKATIDSIVMPWVFAGTTTSLVSATGFVLGMSRLGIDPL